MGPGKQDGAGHDGADHPGQVQQLGNLCSSELAQLGHVGGHVTAKGVDPAGEADGFASARSGRGVFVAGPPAGDGGDVGAGQGLSCVNTEVDTADQRGEGVDDLGALSAHLASRGDQHTDRGPDAAGTWPAQLIEPQPQHSAGDPGGVHDVVLAAGSHGADGRGLGDDDPALGEMLGQPRPVGTSAFDHDQTGPVLGAVADPGEGST
jgi:hypothetical protein